MSDPAPPSSLRSRLILALLAAFVSGAAAGGGAVWVGARRGVAPFPHGFHDHDRRGGPRPEGLPEDMPVRIADKLWMDLALDESLREPIRQIFREGFAETEPIRRRSGEEMKAVFTRQNDRVRALLTPEQQTRFDALMAEWDKRRGPPGHGPPRSKPPDGKSRPRSDPPRTPPSC
jgi:hypothetical protein